MYIYKKKNHTPWKAGTIQKPFWSHDGPRWLLSLLIPMPNEKVDLRYFVLSWDLHLRTNKWSKINPYLS